MRLIEAMSAVAKSPGGHLTSRDLADLHDSDVTTAGGALRRAWKHQLLERRSVSGGRGPNMYAYRLTPAGRQWLEKAREGSNWR